MALFWTEWIALAYSNLELGKRWWIETFDCKEVELPCWDDPLPSDVALTMPGDDEPAILLRDRMEDPDAGLSPAEHHIIFCSKLKKAQEYLLGRGLTLGPIQDGGGTYFFEVRDREGNVIEICEEP